MMASSIRRYISILFSPDINDVRHGERKKMAWRCRHGVAVVSVVWRVSAKDISMSKMNGKISYIKRTDGEITINAVSGIYGWRAWRQSNNIQCHSRQSMKMAALRRATAWTLLGDIIV